MSSGTLTNRIFAASLLGSTIKRSAMTDLLMLF
jgi:hypothetical protein